MKNWNSLFNASFKFVRKLYNELRNRFSRGICATAQDAVNSLFKQS